MLLRCLSLTCVGDEVSGEIAGAECDGGGGQAQLAWRLPTRPLYSHQPLPNISQSSQHSHRTSTSPLSLSLDPGPPGLGHHEAEELLGEEMRSVVWLIVAR